MIALRPAPGYRIGETAQTSRVMMVAVMVSMVAFLDSTVVNLALPATERELGGGMSLQQWVVDGYLLALAATILPGGAISDQFGRIMVMRMGLVVFATGSALAATALAPETLIAGRVVQGLGAAFLVPGSLALINATFYGQKCSAAVGSWTAWTATAFAFGPLLGGLAVDLLSWRWIYALLALPTLIGFAMTYQLGPLRQNPPRARLDVAGATLSAIGLAATVYALIEAGRHGWHAGLAASLVVGAAALVGFVARQRRAAHPLVPHGLFAIRNFAGANLSTAFIYGGLTMGMLAISLYTQEVAGYCATVAGLVTLPGPILSFLLAERIGGLAARIGARPFLTAGPAIAGLGLLLIRPAAHGFNIVTHLLPGMIVLAIGMVLTSTPLTAINLSAVEPAQSGVAAAVQNAVGRTSALASVASMGLIVADTLTDASFGRLLQVAAMLFLVGGAVGFAAIRTAETPRSRLSIRLRR